MFRSWDRWSPLTGVAAVACLVIGLILAFDGPGDTASNAKILSYYAKHSHQSQRWVAFFVTLAGILLFLVFLNVLRDRLFAAEGQPGRITALAFGAGLLTAGLWTLALILGTGEGITANETSKYTVEPNMHRFLSDTIYLVLVSSVVIGALVVWSVSALAIRTAVLPRWYGWLGILVGVLQLFAFVFLPIFIWGAWIVITALILAFRHPAAPARAVAQPAM